PNSAREPTRRQALALLGTAAAAACVGLAGPTAWPAASDEKAGEKTEDAALDEVLRQLQGAEPQSGQGLSTHAPMAAEALCTLGLPEKATPGLKNYRAPVRELPPASRRIDPHRWTDALGPDADAATWEQANGRWGDWKAFFTAELTERPWPDVLDVW